MAARVAEVCRSNVFGQRARQKGAADGLGFGQQLHVRRPAEHAVGEQPARAGPLSRLLTWLTLLALCSFRR